MWRGTVSSIHIRLSRADQMVSMCVTMTNKIIIENCFYIIHLHTQTVSSSGAKSNYHSGRILLLCLLTFFTSPLYCPFPKNDNLLLQNHIIQIPSYIFMMRQASWGFLFLPLCLLWLYWMWEIQREKGSETDNFEGSSKLHPPTSINQSIWQNWPSILKTHKCCACGSHIVDNHR